MRAGSNFGGSCKASKEMINLSQLEIAAGGGSSNLQPQTWDCYMIILNQMSRIDLRPLWNTQEVLDCPTHRIQDDHIAIPTSAGTGSEVTHFAVITEEKTGIKYPLADYELTPDIAIIDVE
ncbi:hypothetical protein AC231_05440 [Clostridium pasteurianum]|nr:hypothetical protein AC231_05440 [Clostridium pasteurianum]